MACPYQCDKGFLKLSSIREGQTTTIKGVTAEVTDRFPEDRSSGGTTWNGNKYLWDFDNPTTNTPCPTCS